MEKNMKKIVPFNVGISQKGQPINHFDKEIMNMREITDNVKRGACLSHNYIDKGSYNLSELKASDFESTNLVFIGFKNSKHPIEEVYYALNYRPSLAYSTLATKQNRYSYVFVYAVEGTIENPSEYFSTLDIFLNIILDIKNRGWYEFLDPMFLDVTKATLPCSDPKGLLIDQSGWYTNFFFARVIQFLEIYEGYECSLLDNSSIPGYTYDNSFFINNNYNYYIKYQNFKKTICLSENGISVPLELLRKVVYTLSDTRFRPLLSNEDEVNHKEGCIYSNVENLEIYKMKTIYLNRGEINVKARDKTLALYAFTLKRMRENIDLVYFSACLYWLNNHFSEEVRMKPMRIIELAIDRFWDDPTEGQLSTKVKHVLNPEFQYLSTKEKHDALNQIRISQRNLKLEKALDLNKRIKGENEKMTGYKKSTIYKNLKDRGLKPVKNYDRFRDELESRQYENIINKEVQEEIGKKLNLTTRTIRRYLKQYREENKTDIFNFPIIKIAS